MMPKDEKQDFSHEGAADASQQMPHSHHDIPSVHKSDGKSPAQACSSCDSAARGTEHVDACSDEDATVAAAIAAGEKAAREDIKADFDKLKKEHDELSGQLEDLQDTLDAKSKEAAAANQKFMRLQADWDNYRRRTAQERLDEQARAAEKLVLSLLPVIDDMERAANHAASLDNKDDNFTQFLDGISQVHDKMLAILAKEGVEVIDPAGKAFDPLIHQAVGRQENKDAYADTVADVYQKGYRMGGKVIRNAMVTVTFGGPARPADTQDDATSSDGASEQAQCAQPLNC